jgi:hypothetical protein
MAEKGVTVTRSLKGWEDALENNSLTNSGKSILRDWREQVEEIIGVIEGLAIIYPDEACSLETYAESLRKDIST